MKEIVIDSNSIKTFANAIKVEEEKLIDIITNIRRDSSDLNTILSSEAGVLFQNSVDEVLTREEAVIKNNIDEFSSTLTKISNIYNEVNDKVEKSVNA